MASGSTDRQREKKQISPLSMVGKTTFTGSYLLSKKSLYKRLQQRYFSYGRPEELFDLFARDMSHLRGSLQ